MNNSHDLKLALLFEKRDENGFLIEEGQISPSTSSGTINLKVSDANGIVDKEIEVPFSSYTSQFVSALQAHFTREGTAYVELDGDSANTYGTGFLVHPYGYIIDKAYYGVVVGGDDGTGEPLTYSNYRLGTQYVHGTSVAQFVHDTNHTVGSVAEVGGKIQFTISRDFTNSSISSISVNEIGIYANISSRSCIIRDILPAPVTVNVGQVLTVTYTLKVNESEGFTRNFMKNLAHSMFVDYSVEEDITLITGSGLTLEQGLDNNSYFRADAEYGIDHYGMQVGTVASGIDSTHYKLFDQVDHGTSTGEVIYNKQNFYGPNTTASGTWFSLERPFYNDTAGSIVIEEVSLMGRGAAATEGNGILFIRSLTGGVTLGSKETVTFKFKLEANI